ncbi:MAG TPA: AraC family transcriptional regulator [Coriobacteriaceae bacterium]|nr:AraC family transcriptional regulator [Coriobacteriaceae bacterium]
MVHIRKDDAVSPTQANPACVVAPLRHIEGERRTYEGFLQPFASHSHSHYAIGFVRRGMRTLECNGETHALVPGDVAVFNPGDVHGCVQSGEGPFAYDSFALPERAFGSTKLAGPVLRNCGARDAFTMFADAVKCAADRHGAEDALFALRDALSKDGVAESIASVPRRNREAALRTYAYLRGHMADPVVVGELAQWEGISEFALIRAYKSEFSITPSQHLLSMRVDCARDLLVRGVSPADVAAATGFSDQAHLTRAFKQRIGSTPAAYRAMVTGGDVQ